MMQWGGVEVLGEVRQGGGSLSHDRIELGIRLDLILPVSRQK